ncbi:Trk system potassium uptake protein [Trypanosoma equiperdum]|uniref:Trk system potassium uptake protein n=1 Tax=Trypanosoma equiperdum TaxID=5694 RepID=A0A1G4I3U0_TRYEQ|nr:Trk system potassium uptake protein [Trypanosoma equiperdum]
MASQGETVSSPICVSNRIASTGLVGLEVGATSPVRDRAHQGGAHVRLDRGLRECEDAGEVPCFNTRIGAKTTLSAISELLELKTDAGLSLTEAQECLVRRINFIRRHYIYLHAAYIMLIALTGATALCYTEDNLAFVDALFAAMSAVCCCGLSTVEVAEWKAETHAFLHVMMLAGGAILTSAYQPLLRLWAVSKLCPMLEGDTKDSDGGNALGGNYLSKSMRLWYASALCVVTTLMYVILVHISLAFFLGMFNRSNLRVPDVVLLAVASFHGAIFSPMEPYVDDPAVVAVASVGCALGFTMFPVLLRCFLRMEWFFFSGVKRLFSSFRQTSTVRQRSLFPADNGEEAALLGCVDVPLKKGAKEGEFEGGVKGYSTWDRAFCDILKSKQPASMHTFLFDLRETVYLGVAWVVITVIAAAPFWFQQWSGDGLLAPYSAPYKVFLALCQAAIVRFGGASFLSCLDYSDSHIAITIMAMYVPPIPVPTYRVYKKWKSVPLAYAIRPFTSRKFWLFVAVFCILIFEEEWPDGPDAPYYDMITRTMFEVVSAFSGCGLSLPPRWSALSFSGTLGVFSKLVIVAVMFAGRHYTVDFSIDIGFNSLP